MNWVLIKNSLLLSSLATLLALSFGWLAALWLAGLAPRWRNVFLALAIVALAFPPFLVTNCWLHYLGHTGVWRRWLPLNIISLGGSAWILALLLWPITLLAVTSAWRRLEPWHLESDLAVTGWPLIRILLFPLARPALTQAAVLTFVLALNNFAVPAILQVKVFPAEMWVRFNTTFDTAGALRLSLPLIVGPLLLLFWFLRREIPWPHLEAPVPPKLLRQQLGRGWFWASGAIALLLFILSVGLPLFQIISVGRTWTELPGALAASQGAVWNSFWFAAVSASVVVALGLVGASVNLGQPSKKSEGRDPKSERRPRSEGENPTAAPLLFPSDLGLRPLPHRKVFGSRPSDFGSPPGFRISAFGSLSGFGSRVSDLTWLLWLFFLVPGVLLGIALIQIFNRSWLAGFYHGAGIVILAFVIRYLALGWNTAQHGSRGIDQDLVDVARLEGATRWQMLCHVLWPQLAPQIRAAWYIVFLLCLWDVESMILVVPPGGETLALRVFNLLHYGYNAQVNALCLTLLVVAVTPLLLWKAASVLRNRSITHHVSRFTFHVSRITHHASRFTFHVSLLLLLIAPIFLLAGCAPSSSTGQLHSQFFDRIEIIGSRGTGVGQLNKPRSVAVDAQDNLYVVDMTGRVQKFSPQGVFLLSWQMPQTDLGKPKGMCRDRAGNIVVLEPHYSRVNHFSIAGQLVAQWGAHGTNAGQLSLPRAVAVNSHNEIFLSEYQEAERVQKFSLDELTQIPPHGTRAKGEAPSSRGEGLINTPLQRGGAADVEVSNRFNGFAPAPRWLASFGQPGTHPGQFNRPEGLCLDSHDQLYVADSCNHRIQVFSNDGKFLRTYGKPGKGRGELSYPYDICVDAVGRQYVCEFGNSRIQIFDSHDQPLEIIGGPGAEPGQFSNPWGVALDSAGNLYVADSQNHRVQKLITKGSIANAQSSAMNGTTGKAAALVLVLVLVVVLVLDLVIDLVLLSTTRTITKHLAADVFVT